MGAKSCEKSLETFALDHNPAIWSKSLQTFLATEVARKVARRKLYRFGCPCYCQILVDCSKQRRRSYTRPGYMKSVWGQWLERVAELHASDDGLDEDCREARQFVVAFRVPYEMFRGIVEAVAPAFPSATHDVAGRECIPLELKVRLCWCSFLFLVHRPVRGEPVFVGRFNFSETEFTTAVGSSRGVGGMNTLV